jgi:hypothetical protein
MVSASWQLRFGVCHEKVNEYTVSMESQLIGGFVVKKHEIKVRRGTVKRLRA